jgi:DNA-binding transcriptional ArsR family regulator
LLPNRSSSSALKIEYPAKVFAALGDPTRLALVEKLNDSQSHSISYLTEGTKITRQAVTRHLTVLEQTGLVSKIKDGRETLYVLDPKPLKSMQEYLEVISLQWDFALNNLKSFIEDQES